MTQKKLFSNLSSEQQYLSNDVENFFKNGLLKSRNLSERTHPEYKQCATLVTKVGARIVTDESLRTIIACLSN